MGMSIREAARRLSAVLVVLAAALMLGLAGCQTPAELGELDGSDPSAGGDDPPDETAPDPAAMSAEEVLDAAERQASAAMAPVTDFTGPNDGPVAVEGIEVFLVSCGMASEGCARPIEGAQEAAAELGWETTVCDGDFDPSQYEDCVNRAISAGADGVYLQAISDEFVADPLERAREAGIEVVSTEGRNEPSPVGVSFEVDANWEEQGRAIGNYLVWRHGADARVLLQYERSYKVMTALNEAAREVIEAAGGTVVDFEFSEAELTTDLPARTVAALRSDDDVTSLVSFDDAVVLIAPELEEAGLLERVDLVGWSLIGPSLEAIRDGRQEASVGPPQGWEGWAAMDTLNRLLAGEQPVDQELPVRLITPDNVDDIPQGQSWDGDVDYRERYRAIWGAE